MTNGQNRTIPDTERELTPQMWLAVDALATGASVTEAAQTANVTRQTVSGWLNQNPAFQSALGIRRNELWRLSVVKMRALIPKAIAAVEAELETQNKLKAATMIFELSGFESASSNIAVPDTLRFNDDGVRSRPFSDDELRDLLSRASERREGND